MAVRNLPQITYEPVRNGLAKRPGLMLPADKGKLDKLYTSLPSARVYHNANQSIANNVQTALAFNSERWDTHGFHVTGAGNTKLTVPASRGGLYLVGATLYFDSSAGGARRNYAITLNAVTFIGQEEDDSHVGAYPVTAFSTLWPLAAGDYVEVWVFQDSGAALNIIAQPAASPEFWLIRLGD